VIRPPFPPVEGAPPPLRGEVSRRVRFEEVDPLGIVWHGRYPSFLEDAREALYDRVGIGNLALREQGVVAPIRVLHVEYHRPLRYPETFTVEAILHWCESARLNLEFVLRNSAGEVATTAHSVQMLLDGDNNVLLVHPPVLERFLDRWKKGALP
jgi:acyl-CoA thioester hydrolase